MYFPLAWHFCSKSSQNKIGKIQYRSLKLITNNYNSDYKFLLNESGISTMEIKRLRTLTLGTFKTLNNLNPKRRHGIFVHSRITLNYGDRSLRALGAHSWNSLPENKKSNTSIIIFKDLIKNWFGPKCKYKLCLQIVSLHTE